MAARTITLPADNAALVSSVVRNQLQLIETEVAAASSIDPGHLHTADGLQTTGTPSSSTFLNGAFEWEVPTAQPVGASEGVNYAVSGTINGSNVTFTIPVEVSGDFELFLARQPQAPTIAGSSWTADYSYVVGVGVTTISYLVAPDASLSGQPHWAFIVIPS